MAKTLLAVDDSVTMRKVLDITFSGEDFRVITADTHKDAIGKLSEGPDVVVIDTILGSDDGYALAKEVRQKSPNAAVLLLASRYNPYDQAKGVDAGADDFMDKPFDTQQLIDKVKKALATRGDGAGARPAAAAAAAPPAAAAAAPAAAAPAAAAARPAPAPTPAAATAQAAKGSRQPTLMFGGSEPPGAAPAAGAVKQAPVAPGSAPRSPNPALGSTAAAVNGQMQSKLGELGLSPQQAEAVMALSREVVERVVWEVVPQLAEALIKEEIARLTRE